ncbi:MAG TPA: hypothetical protein VGC55_12650 [Dokdonella sp.]
MTRVALYGSLALLIAIGAWLFWSGTHADTRLARARTEQAERMQADPPPRLGTQEDEDRDNALQLGAIPGLQSQLSGIVATYCKDHGAMPVQFSDLGAARAPATIGIDRTDLQGGVIAYHVAASELHAQGTIRYTPVLDGACAGAWQCSSDDYPRIANWLADCRYSGMRAAP